MEIAAPFQFKFKKKLAILSSKNLLVKVFKNGPSKICGRQPSKNLKLHGLLKAWLNLVVCLKAVFHKFYLVHYGIL